MAVGSAAALNLHPAGALTVGAIAGSLSTLGFGRLTPWLEAKTGLGDTCGIHNLHGCPGILGGLVAGFASFTAANAAAAPHGRAQLAWQLLALAATIGVAALGGAAAGWAVSRANPYSQLIDGAHLFDDGLVWQGVDLELSAQVRAALARFGGGPASESAPDRPPALDPPGARLECAMDPS